MVSQQINKRRVSHNLLGGGKNVLDVVMHVKQTAGDKKTARSVTGLSYEAVPPDVLGDKASGRRKIVA